MTRRSDELERCKCFIAPSHRTIAPSGRCIAPLRRTFALSHRTFCQIQHTTATTFLGHQKCTQEMVEMELMRKILTAKHVMGGPGQDRARKRGNVGSSGLVVRAPDCRSRGRWFDSTSAVSKLGQFRSPHFARVFRKRQ